MAKGKGSMGIELHQVKEEKETYSFIKACSFCYL
jgi:hypothetical protein